MQRNISRKICSSCLCALALIISLHSPVHAETESDLQTLELFYEGKDLVVSATRSPKPLSQTAENVTVITAAEIEMMGAHTLVDVLANVSGLQVSDRGGIGHNQDFFLHGANTTHILVMLDGVNLNFYSSQTADIGIIPVQNVERIEIIKGPGSSSWGSALGGVINIVTKSPPEERKVGGTLSFSADERGIIEAFSADKRGTREGRSEVSGTRGIFGYYLYAGNLTSNGFRPNTASDLNNLFAKLRWELPDRGSLQFTLAYDRGTAGDGDLSAFNFSSKFQRRYFLFTAAFNYPLNDKTDLDISYRTTLKKTLDSGIFLFDDPANGITAGMPLSDITSRESAEGGSLKLTWRGGIQSLVAGADFDHLQIQADPNLIGIGQNLFSDKYGLFFNDTLTLGSLAITPGIRYDRMRPVGDFFSPSLGAAWSLNEQTTLRAYLARGYSLPLLFSNVTQEKVITIQGGVETTQVPYLWLKATLFLNYISDIQDILLDANGNLILDANGNPIVIFKKQKKQGFEVEIRTVPFFNTSLSAGYTFVDAKNRDTGEVLPDIPRQILKLGLHYDDKRSFRASFLGRYVRFNATPDWREAKDSAIVWDLNLAKKVLNYHDTSLELFFTGHNIFNGAQYSMNVAKNARRWVEGGIRFNF